MVYFKRKNIQYASCVIRPACSWELALLIWFCSFCSLSLDFKNASGCLLYILECTWLQILRTVCYETAKILRCSRIHWSEIHIYTCILNLRNKLECNLSTLASVTWLILLVCKCCLEGLRNLSQSSDTSPVLPKQLFCLLSDLLLSSTVEIPIFSLSQAFTAAVVWGAICHIVYLQFWSLIGFSNHCHNACNGNSCWISFLY